VTFFSALLSRIVQARKVANSHTLHTILSTEEGKTGETEEENVR
jgi:hypothetical protein